MTKKLSEWLDFLSNFLAHRKGLLPLSGLVLILVNFLIVIFLPGTWITETNLFLHLGAIVSITGLLLARAL